MAIEEITLSVPRDLPESGGSRSPPAASGAVNPDDRVVARYRRLLLERDRFAWTRRGRRRRQEVFEVAYRSLVKELAREATEPIRDRSARLKARTRVYSTLTGFLAVTTADQRRLRYRARKLFRWGLGLFTLSLCALVGVAMSLAA